MFKVKIMNLDFNSLRFPTVMRLGQRPPLNSLPMYKCRGVQGYFPQDHIVIQASLLITKKPQVYTIIRIILSVFADQQTFLSHFEELVFYTNNKYYRQKLVPVMTTTETTDHENG